MSNKIPPEWHKHSGTWLAWPAAEDLWLDDLAAAQKEFILLVNEISKSEDVYLVCPHEEIKNANSKFRSPRIHFFEASYGDIWLRDTAPVFCFDSTQNLSAVTFTFNGWGKKYRFPDDLTISEKILKFSKLEKNNCTSSSLVTEGGALEFDEFGTLLTTDACLIDDLRNPNFTKGDIESELKKTLGVKKILWLQGTLLNDHTDGHIDTLARFLPGGKVICMTTKDKTDPNFEVLASIREQLSQFKNAENRALEVIEVPSPGLVEDEDGEPMPASYMNYYISNGSVIVPTYESAFDHEAVTKIGACFPGRKTLGIPAQAILKGGGAFHCITQQQPAK